MTITSNLYRVKNFIGELQKVNLGNLSGRVVTFIRDNGLLFGIAASVSIAAFFYFRSKYLNSELEDNNKIIGSRLNLPPTDKSQFIDEARMERAPIYNKLRMRSPNEINTSKGEIVSFRTPSKHLNTVLNYTKHRINFDQSQNFYLDGFQIPIPKQELDPTFPSFFLSNHYSLFPFNNRRDLISLLYDEYSPEKLIVLEEVANKQFVISWIMDAKDFCRRPTEGNNEEEKYSFIFSITKIDAFIYRKKIFEFIFMSHFHDAESAFASMPRDIINHIVKSL